MRRIGRRRVLGAAGAALTGAAVGMESAGAATRSVAVRSGLVRFPAGRNQVRFSPPGGLTATTAVFLYTQGTPGVPGTAPSSEIDRAADVITVFLARSTEDRYVAWLLAD